MGTSDSYKSEIESFSISLNEVNSSLNGELVGLDEVRNFFEQELQFWQKFSIKDNITREYFTYLKKILDDCQSIITLANQKNESRIPQLLLNLKVIINNPKSSGMQFSYIYSDSIEAKFLLEVYNQDNEEFIGALSYFTSDNFRPSANKKQYIGSMKSIFFEMQMKDKINYWEQAASISWDEFFKNAQINFNGLKKEFEVFRSNYQGLINEWASSNSDFYKKNENLFKTKLEDYTNELNDLQLAYRDKLQYEGPVKFWEERAIEYKSQGRRWLYLMTITTLISLILLFSVLYSAPDAFHHKLLNGDPEAIRGIIIFALIISFLGYFIRIFSKLVFSSFHLQRDSEEREQLTKVYIAMRKDGNLVNSDKELILQSLFSRADYGLLNKHDGPTMPGLTSIIEKIFKS